MQHTHLKITLIPTDRQERLTERELPINIKKLVVSVMTIPELFGCKLETW